MSVWRSVSDWHTRGGGALAKNWWQAYSFSPTDPLFWLALTQWLPFLIINNQFLTIVTEWTPFLTKCCQNFQFFFLTFVKNVSRLVFCPENWSKFVKFSPFWPPFLVFSVNDPIFWRKISHGKTTSFELLSEYPSHFQSWVSQPRQTFDDCDDIPNTDHCHFWMIWS